MSLVASIPAGNTIATRSDPIAAPHGASWRHMAPFCRVCRSRPGTGQHGDASPLDLVHRCGNKARKPTIRFFDNRTIFWSLAAVFASADDLFDPGEKERRNPGIVAAFRRTGLSEQGGTGIRAATGNRRQPERVPPTICNGRVRKAFQLILVKEKLLSHASPDDAEAKTSAFTCREGRAHPTRCTRRHRPVRSQCFRSPGAPDGPGDRFADGRRRIIDLRRRPTSQGTARST